MFKETKNEMSSGVVVEIYYKISDEEDNIEETTIKSFINRNCYPASKFNLGNNGMIVASFVNVIDNSVVIKFDINEQYKNKESNLSFRNMFLIPEDLKYDNKDDEIIIANGKTYDLNYPDELIYNKKYTIGIKSIKYGKFFEI